MYFAMANTCAWTTSVSGPPTPEMLYAINTQNVIAPDAAGNAGTVRTISVETGKESWRYDQRVALMALLATGGDLVFGGDLAGTLRAFDAATGEVLWETNVGASITGHPVTFAVDGRQHVAVSTGRSNMTGGLTRLTPEAVPGESPNKLFVFALPD
jgi:alcohol dehydrogenase (cytochrome c)